jgi:hypothetical protein
VRWDDRTLNADAFVSYALDPDGAVREVRMEPEVSPRIPSINQHVARGLKEQCAHDAVIPHGLRSQRRPHHARYRSIAKVPA